MKRLILIVILAISLAGCATATVTTKHVDGKQTECSGSYFSVLKDISAVNMSACGSKGSAGTSTVNTALAAELFKVLLTTVAP